MAAHFDALGATTSGLTLPQLYAVLRRLGLLRAAPPDQAPAATPGPPLSPQAAGHAKGQRFSPAAMAAIEGVDAEQEALVQLLWRQLATPAPAAGNEDRVSLRAMAKFMTSDEPAAAGAGSEATPREGVTARTRSALVQQSMAAKHTDLSSSRAARSHARGRCAAASPSADAAETPVQPRGLSFSPQLSTPGFSPRSPRSEVLSGRTVFEALYEHASHYKRRAEQRRISLSEEVRPLSPPHTHTPLTPHPSPHTPHPTSPLAPPLTHLTHLTHVGHASRRTPLSLDSS